MLTLLQVRNSNPSYLKSCHVEIIPLLLLILHLVYPITVNAQSANTRTQQQPRERIALDTGWKFFKYPDDTPVDELIYDRLPEISGLSAPRTTLTHPGRDYNLTSPELLLKPWILPTGNAFIADPNRHFLRPEGNPGSDFPFVQTSYDDTQWEEVELPHDWAIKGPFYQDAEPRVGGGMGRLPSPGVAWYLKKIFIPASDQGRLFYLEVEGAMSYAMVWLNGHLVGGWPSGFTSWQLDLTPYIKVGTINQLAIRLANPNHSMRWYPGGGIYRPVWLIKTAPIHVAQWGTFISVEEVTKTTARLKLILNLANHTNREVKIKAITKIYPLNSQGIRSNKHVAIFTSQEIVIPAASRICIQTTTKLNNPRLWGPPPSQSPHCYLAITTLEQGGKTIDQYETRFGIRILRFDPDSGLFINGELIKIKGVNLHHDLGALGAAFNRSAAIRQLKLLRELGCNAVRTAHNPPAPEFLELTDLMGFLVMDEAFDMWLLPKNPHDLHLVFPDWHEQDLRAMVRRDRNCPSVIMWSIGNEVGEQYTGVEGATLAQRLYSIVKEEDPTRPVTCALNYAKPDMPLPAMLDVICLNYQGEGIRQDPEFEGTDRIRTPPQYVAFHQQFPQKMILSSETASAFSSRGVYLFPVTNKQSDFVREGRGGSEELRQVSAYELYAADFGSSADKVFSSLARHPFVAGEFVWSGFDYLGEPTPYYAARSSYCGIFDLAGFKKDRFYLYQAQWRPELPLVHILPHWNWPERVGLITPVHVFTSGDEVELFLNGRSLGRKQKGLHEYRLRWDEVVYEPGELHAVAYKNGRYWAEDRVRSTNAPAALKAIADREVIAADSRELAFITVQIIDQDGLLVPTANNQLQFKVDGCGELVATDNGDPTDFTPFPSPTRKAFNGQALGIIRARKKQIGPITVTITSDGLAPVHMVIQSQAPSKR